MYFHRVAKKKALIMGIEIQKPPENGTLDNNTEGTSIMLGDDPALAPPDGGFGWICVAACFTVNCFTWGVVSVRIKHL